MRVPLSLDFLFPQQPPQKRWKMPGWGGAGTQKVHLVLRELSLVNEDLGEKYSQLSWSVRKFQ